MDSISSVDCTGTAKLLTHLVKKLIRLRGGHFGLAVVLEILRHAGRRTWIGYLKEIIHVGLHVVAGGEVVSALQKSKLLRHGAPAGIGWINKADSLARLMSNAPKTSRLQLREIHAVGVVEIHNSRDDGHSVFLSKISAANHRAATHATAAASRQAHIAAADCLQLNCSFADLIRINSVMANQAFLF